MNTFFKIIGIMVGIILCLFVGEVAAIAAGATILVFIFTGKKSN